MTKNKQEVDTNYSFLLECMTALTTASIITAGIIAAVALKSAALSATAVAMHTLLASSLIFTPTLPIALIAIGFVFLLPFWLGCNNNTHTTVRVANPGYKKYGFYSDYTSGYSHDSYSDRNDPGSEIDTGIDRAHEADGSHMHGHDGSHVHDHGGNHNHGHF